MTVSDNLSAIEKTLEGVTPGKWEVWEERTPTKADAIAEMTYQVENSEPFVEAVYLLNAGGKCPATTGCGPTSAANAAYIAACSPDRMREVLALARQAEALQRENAELRAVMKECHAALNMMISPGDISGSTVLGAFAAAKSAEARARALLGGENAGN